MIKDRYFKVLMPFPNSKNRRRIGLLSFLGKTLQRRLSSFNVNRAFNSKEHMCNHVHFSCLSNFIQVCHNCKKLFFSGLFNLPILLIKFSILEIKLNSEGRCEWFWLRNHEKQIKVSRQCWCYAGKVIMNACKSRKILAENFSMFAAKLAEAEWCWKILLM